MAKKQGAWIDVYPAFQTSPILRSEDKKFKLNYELEKHTSKLWSPKYEKGWKSSWVPFVSKVESADRDYVGELYPIPHFEIKLGTMAYSQIEGINNSIENNLSFSPEQGFNNCLSVGLVTSTEDGKVTFQRRPSNVHCPNILIHEPCGYMTSLAFAPRDECDNPKYSQDKRLFDLGHQLKFRAKEITEKFGLGLEDIEYNAWQQDLLGAGWKSIEMYFSTTGKLKAKEKDLNLPKDEETFFVPFEHIKDLIYNQGRLSKIDATNYRPEDPREIPLIDESLVGLIWGYEKLTGDKLDIPETVDRLNRDGLEINVYDTSPGKNYEFPTEF